MDGLKGVAMGVKHRVEGCRDVLQQVDANRDLDRVGGTLPAAVRVGSGPIPGDHADAGMRLQPEGHGLRLTIGQEGERSTPLEIHHDGPIGPAFPQGPVVDTEHLGGRHVGEGQKTQQAQEGIATDGEAQATAQTCPGRSRQRHGDRHQPLRAPLRPPRPGGDKRCQPLGKHTAWAAAIGAAELPHIEAEHDAPWPPREIRHRADIATMNTPRWKPADRTMDQRLCRGHLQRQLSGGVVHVPGVEMQLGDRGKPVSQECHGSPSPPSMRKHCFSINESGKK